MRQLAEAPRRARAGAFNALSARVIEDLGFEAICVTGAGVTNMGFGLPPARASWACTRSPRRVGEPAWDALEERFRA